MRGGENAPSRHMSPLLQVPRALIQGGDRPGGGHPRRNKVGVDRTNVPSTPAGVRTTAHLAQRQRRSPVPQVPRALIWQGRDGSPQVPRHGGPCPAGPSAGQLAAHRNAEEHAQEAVDPTSGAQHHQAGPGGFSQEFCGAE